MSDLQEQRELERRLSEAIALAQSIVEENSRENSSTNSNNESSAAPADDDTVDSKREPGPHRRVNKTSCKLVWKIVFAISVFAVLVCVCLAVRYVRGHNRSLRAENRLRTYVDRGTDTSDGPESAEGNYPELDVNFAGLKTQNGDICAWIYIYRGQTLTILFCREAIMRIISTMMHMVNTVLTVLYLLMQGTIWILKILIQ